MYSELLSLTYHIAHNVSHVPSENFLIHSHPFYEFYYFLSGDVHILYDGVEYEMSPHTLVVFVPHAFHGIHVLSKEPFERYIAHFTEDLIAPSRRAVLLGNLPTLEGLRSRSCKAPHILQQARNSGILEIMQEFEALNSFSEPARSAMIGVLTEHLLTRYLLASINPGNMTQQSSYHPGEHELAPILDYIHQNLHKPFSLDDLCTRFHISKSKMNNLFRSQLSITPIEYVTRRRVYYAQQLLLNGIPAAQSGDLAGFGDYTGFYRAYRRILGHAPSEDCRPGHAETGSDRMPWPGTDAPESKSLPDPGSEEETIWTRNRATQVTSVDIAVLRD